MAISYQTEYPLAFAIFQSFRAAFLSTTGAVITLPYCYCNSEVRRAVQTRYTTLRIHILICCPLYCRTGGHDQDMTLTEYESLFQVAEMENGSECGLREM